MRAINEIVVHCTATQPSWGASWTPERQVQEIRNWHVNDRGWNDIGYHYVITRDGRVATGRPVDRVGAHVAGHNTGTIGVSLVGGFGSAADDQFADNFTPEQDAALRALIEELRARFPAINKISGHNEYANKACPGFDVMSWLDRQPQITPATNVSASSEPEVATRGRTSAAQSTTVQASAVQLASAAGAGVTAVTALEGPSQIVAIVFAGVIALAALWIMRERLKKWSAGVK